MLREHDISQCCSCSLLSSSENNNYYQFFMFLGLALVLVCMKNATMQKHSSTLEGERLPKSLVRLAKKPLTVGRPYELSLHIGPALKDNHLLLNRTIHWGWGSVWNSPKPFKIAKLPTLSFSQESPDSWLTWSWCHVNTTTPALELESAYSQTGKIWDRLPYTSLHLSMEVCPQSFNVS